MTSVRRFLVATLLTLVVLAQGILDALNRANADETQAITIEQILQPRTVSQLIKDAEATPSRPNDYFVSWTAKSDQTEHVFTLEPGATAARGAGASSVYPGHVPATDHWQGISWIAVHYRDFKVPGWKDEERNKYRAAAQIAIWALAASSTTSPTWGIDDISAYAKTLYLQAADSENGPPDSSYYAVETGKLDVTHGDSFFDGESLRLRVLLPDGQSLPGQFLTVSDADGHPYTWGKTNRDGSLRVDVPWSLQGPLKIEWVSTMQSGTIMQTGTSHLVTTQAMTIQDHRDVPHTDPGAQGKGLQVWTGASRQLSGSFGMFILGGYVLLSLLALVLTKAVSDRVANGGWVWLISGLVAVLVTLGGGTALARKHQDQNFRPQTSTALPSSTNPDRAQVVSVSSTSAFDPSHQAGCATDGKATTAWVSGRGQGIDQVLDIKLSQPAAIASISIVPGYASLPDAFPNNGYPLRLQVLSTAGDYLEWSTSKRPNAPDAMPGEELTFPNPSVTDDLLVRVVGQEQNTFSYAISEVTLYLALPGQGIQSVPTKAGGDSSLGCI